jgi:diguanylate cyclase (GGDEF)-like protein
MSRKNAEVRQTTQVIQGDSGSLRKDRQKARYQEPCLIVIRGKFQGHRFFIDKPELTLGRDASVDIVIPEQNISRRHAWIIREGGEVKIRDLDSSNGVFVNDRRVEPKETVILKKEDMIRIGDTVLKFLPAGEIETVFYDRMLASVHLDSLTQAYKRPYLLEALEVEFKRAKALHTEFSLLFFIIDHFKLVNDTHGHDAGDHVLREFAAVIRNSGVMGPDDLLARYGGEEFILLLPGTSGAKAQQASQLLRSEVEAHPFIYEGTRIQVTSSYGISELQVGIESAQSLLKQASQALDEPRKTLRGQIVLAN